MEIMCERNRTWDGAKGAHGGDHSDVDTSSPACQHHRMCFIFKCCACGKLREMTPTCIQCGDDVVEVLVMQEEANDDYIDNAWMASPIALNPR